MSSFLCHLLTIITCAPSVLLVSFFFGLMSTTNLSLDPDYVVSLAMTKLKKGYRCYDHVSHHLRVFRNVVFWEHRFFVELSHFRSSLSTFSVLEIFPDESHIPSIIAPNPPLDFSTQPPDIFDVSLRSPSNEQVEDEQVEYELSNFELGSPALASLEDLAQEIPPRLLTQVRSIPAHLLDHYCYTALTTLHKSCTYREASTNYLLHIAMKEERDALSKNHCERPHPSTRFWMLG